MLGKLLLSRKLRGLARGVRGNRTPWFLHELRTLRDNNRRFSPFSSKPRKILCFCMGYSENLKLSDDLRSQCPTLFSELGTVIISECRYPDPFGNAWIQLRIDSLFFLFVWERNFPEVRVFLNQIGDWYNLNLFVAQPESMVFVPQLFARADVAIPVPQTWPECCDFLSYYLMYIKAKISNLAGTRATQF